jgi:hypothetical protein
MRGKGSATAVIIDHRGERNKNPALRGTMARAGSEIVNNACHRFAD